MTVPYFDVNVKAGFPSPAMDYIEERIDLNKELIQHPLSTFIVECTGDSMLWAIPERAQLLVDRSVTPVHGDIVLAALNGDFTVKFLKKIAGNGWLVPANKKYPSIQVTEEMIIWGKVIRIITEPKDLRVCMPL